MSKSIDQRVVQMEFDNSRFESNVSTTMSTLDKLKEKLNFGKSAESLNELEQAGKKFNLDPMESAVDKIAERFTLLGSIGFNAMEKIAKAAVDAGEKIVKSLTVDQMAAGFEKYQAETNAVQAMYSALKRKTKGDGSAYQLEDVYKALDDLADYADWTSYSYSQMTEQMKRFIAAGVSLDEAEMSMEGISNAAALAGVSIRDTDIIYRNFADAISSGKLQAKDWISLEGSIGTEAFRQQIIDTAIAMGKLDAEANAYSETGKKVGQVTTANFKEMLRYGFATREVLIETLRKYGDTENEVLAQEGFQAAKVSQTWQDVMDSVADAASSGWRKVYRIIFGNYTEAAQLFTGIADTLVDEVIAPINEALDTIFSSWREHGGRDAMIEGLQIWWSNLKEVATIIGDAFSNIFGRSFNWDLETAGSLLASATEKIRDAGTALDLMMSGDSGNGKARGRILYDIAKGFASAFDIVVQSFGGVRTVLRNVRKQLGPAADKAIQLLGDFGQKIFNLSERLRKSEFFTKLGNRVSKWFVPLTSRLPGVIDKIRELYDRFSEFLRTNPLMVQLGDSVRNLANAVIDHVPDAIEGLINFGSAFFNMVKESDEWKWLKSNFDEHVKPILTSIADFAGKAVQGLADFINFDTSEVEGTWWDKFKARFAVFDDLGPWISNKWEKLKQKFPIFQQVEDWWDTSKIAAYIREFSSTIWKSFDAFMSVDTSGETSIIEKLKKRFSALWDELGPWLTEKWENFKKKYPIIDKISDFFSNLFGGQSEEDGNWDVGKGFITLFSGIFNGIKDLISNLSLGDVLTLSAIIKILFDIGKRVVEWKWLKEGVFGIFEEVSWTVSEAYDVVHGQRVKTKIRQLLGVAASIWLLADALKRIAQMSWEQIGRGLTGMAGLFLEEGAFIVAMGALANTGNFKFNAVNLSTYIGIALSVLILGNALKNVAELEWEEIAKGLTAMGGVFLEEGAFMVAVSNLTRRKFTEKDSLGIIRLLGVALNIKILGSTLKSLSELEWEGIAKGLTAMGGIFLEEGAFIVAVNNLTRMNLVEKDSAGIIKLIGVALNIRILGAALKSLADLSWEGIAKGLTAMGGIFLEEGAFIVAVNNLTRMNLIEKDSAGILKLLGVALNIRILGTVLKSLSELSWEEIGKGLTAMAGIFLGESGFLFLLRQISEGTNGFGGIQAATGALSIGISMLGNTVANLGKMSIGQLITGGLAMAAIATVLGIFSKVMSLVHGIHIGSMTGVVLLALGLNVLAQAIIPLGQFSWDQALIGVLSLGAIMAEMSGFVTYISTLSVVKIGSVLSIVGLAEAMNLLADAVVPLGNLDLTQAVTGVLTLAGIMVAMSLFVRSMQGIQTSIRSGITTLLYSISLTIVMGAFADACKQLKDVDPAVILAFAAATFAIGVALAAMGATMSLFQAGKISSVIKSAVSELLSAVILAGAMYLFVEGIKMVKDIDPEMILTFAASVLVVGVAISAMSVIAGIVGHLMITTILKGAVSEFLAAAILAGAMFLFIKAIEQVKDYDPEVIRAFGDACVSVSLAIDALSVMVIALGALPISMILKGALALAGIIVIVGLIVNLAAYLVGNALEGFSESMASAAGGLVVFSDLIQQVDFEKIGTAVDSMKTIATDMVEIGTKNYGNFEFFRTQLSLLGSSISQFDSLIFGFDSENAKTVVADVVAMANSLSGISEVSDVSNTIANIGAAIKLYAESVNGVTIDEAPDSSQLSAALQAIANMTLPSIDSITELASFGTEDSGIMLTNMALGITNLGTAVSSFSTDMASVDFTNVGKGIGALEQISAINDNVKEVKVTNIGIFGKTIVESKPGLTDFANNIVLLGDALKQFGTSLTGEGLLSNVDAGVTALGKFQEIEAALPKIGGLTQWFEGEQDLSELATDLPTLGAGLKAFGDALTEEGLTEKVDAGVEVLGKFADIQAKLPAAQGIVQLFKGEQTLSTLSKDLPSLGTALAEFSKPFQTLDVSDTKIKAATTILGELASIYETMPNIGGFVSLFEGEQTLGAMGDDLKDLGPALAEFAKPFQTLDVSETKIKAATNVLGELAALYEKMPNLGGMAQWFTGSNSFKGFADELGYLGTGLKEFATNYGNTTMPQNMTDILAPLQTMGEMALGMQIYEDVNGITASMSKIEALEDFVDTFKRIKDTIIEIGKSINNAENRLGFDKFSSFSTPIQDMINSLNTLNTMQINEGAGLKDFTWLTSQLDTAFEDIGAIVTTHGGVNGDFSEFVSPITNCFDSIKKAMEQPENMEAPKFAETVSTFYESLSTAFDGGAVSAELIGKMVVTGIAKGIKSEDSKTTVQKGLYYTVMESGSAYMKGHSDEVFNPVGVQLITSVIGGLNKDGSMRIQNAGINIISEAARLIASVAKSKFYNVGEMICQGIAAGIKNSSAIAAGAASYMAEQALAKAKKVLGIRSPSKEFARLGEYSSEGYAKGIEKELGVVEKSVEKIRDKAEDVLSEPLGYRDVYTGKWGGTPQPEDNSEAIEELKNGIREDMKKLRNALPSQSSNSGSRGNGGGGGSSAGIGDATGKGIGEAVGKGIGEAATAGNKIADAASKTAIGMANVEMSMEDLAILMEQMPELAERCAISYTNAADAMAASMGGPILEDNAEAEALMAEMLALYGLNPDEYILKPVITPVYDDSYLSDEEIASLTSEEQAPITNDQMTLVGASIIAAIKNCSDQFSAAIGQDTMGNIIDSINQVKQQVESAEAAITNLGDRMSDIQVILDSGVLVGELAPGIDAELANYTDHSSRGL